MLFALQKLLYLRKLSGASSALQGEWRAVPPNDQLVFCPISSCGRFLCHLELTLRLPSTNLDNVSHNFSLQFLLWGFTKVI